MDFLNFIQYHIRRNRQPDRELLSGPDRPSSQQAAVRARRELQVCPGVSGESGGSSWRVSVPSEPEVWRILGRPRVPAGGLHPAQPPVAAVHRPRHPDPERCQWRADKPVLIKLQAHVTSFLIHNCEFQNIKIVWIFFSEICSFLNLFCWSSVVDYLRAGLYFMWVAIGLDWSHLPWVPLSLRLFVCERGSFYLSFVSIGLHFIKSQVWRQRIFVGYVSPVI